MKIVTAKTAGFCMGVRRAVESALDAPSKQEGPIYTYGPLIHNPQIIELLNQRGIAILEEIPEKGHGTVLIRAHGVPPDARRKFEDAGFTVIDATCPRVIRVQRIITKYTRKGYTPIILGNRSHPEVVGLLGHTDGKGHVVESMDELLALPDFEKAIIVAQTTQNTDLFEQVRRWAEETHPSYKVFNTICDSTEKRQAEVRELAREVDAVVVVGGKSSGNTKRLAEIARKSGKPAFHVETEEDLDLAALRGTRRVGITAGASTPNWITQRVQNTIREIPYRNLTGVRRLLRSFQRTLLLSSVYLSLGAAALAYACNRLQHIEANFPHVLIAMFYVMSMHILNNLTGIKADLYNDPDRAAFYTDHRRGLTVLAGLAGLAGLAAALSAGRVPFLLLLVMTLLGLSYKLRIIPAFVSRGRYRRLSDIPGSKTTLIAVAWGVVTAVLPALAAFGTIRFSTILVFLWCAASVFVRTVFFEILEIHGDRIVGRETIPLLIGEKRSLAVLKKMLKIIPLFLLACALLRLVSSVGIPLAACSLFLYLLIAAYQRGMTAPGFRTELIVDFYFILVGVVTFAWSALVAGP